MKRYLVFAGHTAVDRKGWETFRAGFDTHGAAMQWARTITYDWWQVVDTASGAIINIKQDVFDAHTQSAWLSAHHTVFEPA